MFCAECGSVLKVPDETQIEAPPKNQPRLLNAGSATKILFANVAVQVFLGTLMAVIAVAMALAHGIDIRERLTELLNDLAPAMKVMTPIVCGIVTVLMSIAVIPEHLKNTSPTGAAWVRGSWLALAEGLAIGLIVGAFFYAVNMFMRSHLAYPHATYRDPGPFERMAYSPGLPQTLWMVTAVLLAPPAEEILFRGVLYGGYRKSFGPIWATISTTLIFVLSHLPVVIHSPPTIAAFIVLSLAALWCRLRSNAIGPAITVHIGYNAVIALVIAARTWH